MATFGVHSFVWNGDWNNAIVPETIRQAEKAGFDLLEIPLLRPAELDTARIKKLLKDHHLQAACSLALPKDKHMPFYPQQSLEFLKLAVDVTAALDVTRLCGCLYCNLGTLTGKPPTKAELDTCANVLGEVANYARGKGVRLGVEPVNRYETYVLNSTEDTVKLIDAIGAEDMFVHLDTYHMNIEEHGYSGPIKQGGKRIGYIHLSESDRGIPGKGNVDWDDVFAGLKAINFQGPLVMEAFAAINPDLTAATCLWRPRTYTAWELATQGLALLRAKAQVVGLS